MAYCWKVQVSTGIIILYVILGKNSGVTIVIVLDNFNTIYNLNFIKKLLEIKYLENYI